MTVTVYTWKHHGNGSWTDAQDWSNGVPTAGDEALLLAQTLPYTVTSNSSVSLDLLEIGVGVSLDIGGGDFTIASTLNGATSYLVNDGLARVAAGATLTLSGSGNAVVLSGQGRVVLAGSTSGKGGVLDVGSSLELTGMGTIKLNAGATITSSAAANLLNVDDTIMGAGMIGGELSLENGRAGVIEANGANGAALIFDFTQVKSLFTQAVASDDDFANYGLIETTGSGALTIESDLYNEGELLAASTGALTIADDAVCFGDGLATVAAGGLLVLHEGTLDLTGGLTIDAGGVLKTTAGDADDAILGAFTAYLETSMLNLGQIDVVAGSTLQLEGILVQRGAGALDLLGTKAHTAELVVGAGGLQISGGILQLGSGNTLGNEIVSDGEQTFFENNGTVEGAGTIGDGILDFVNEAKGIFDANGSQALSLDVSADSSSSAVFLNEGLIETTGAGGLILTGNFENYGALDAKGSGHLVIDAAFEAVGGSVNVGAGATLVLDPESGIVSFVALSLISIAAGGTVETVAADTSKAYDEYLVGNLTNAGTIDVLTGSGLVAGGVWNNTGAITIGGSSAAPSGLEIDFEEDFDVDFGAPLLTLTGGGTLKLTSAYSAISGLADGSTLDNVNNIISGQGNIGTGDNLAIENGLDGTIDAVGGTLILDPTPFDDVTSTSYLHNAGLLEASAGATLEISQQFVNNGRIVAQSGGSVVLDDAVTGFGEIEIMGKGAVQLVGVSDDAIAFFGSGGRLIEDSLDPSATISGFAKGDAIDLDALGFVKGTSTFSYVANSSVDALLGGVLTVSGFDASGDAASETIALSGNFANAKFSLGDDKVHVGSNFGTVVTVS